MQSASDGINIDLGVDTFDMTSLDLEFSNLPSGGATVSSPEHAEVEITDAGTTVLSWTGLTLVMITPGRLDHRIPIPSVDNIVISGRSKANNGKKGDKVSVCHVDENGNVNLITSNGNALNAHLAHGDRLPKIGLGTGKLICKVFHKPPQE